MKYSHIRVLEGHSAAVYALHFKANENTLYSAGGDGMVGAWDLESGEPKPFSVKTDAAIFSLSFDDARNRMLIGQGEGGIHVIDRAEKQELRHLKYHTKGIFQLLSHPAESLLYALGGDGALTVADAETYQLRLTIPLSHTKLRVALMDSAAKHLLVGGSDGHIYTVETGYYNLLGSVMAHDGGVYAMAWLSPNTLISGGRDGHLRFWEFDGSTLMPSGQAIPAHNFAVYAIEVHPNGGLFATASRDKTIKIWSMDDLLNPMRIARKGLEGHTHSVNRLAWIEGGKVLASAGDDKKIRLWGIAL